jgi:hypothetical protein
MVQTREYRVVMPLTLDEYARGQLYTTAAFSKAETSGGEGIEVVKNEPYHDHPTMGSGQYTYKIYHLSSKVPAWVRVVAPSGSLELHEEAWNGFPKIKTVLVNKYMGDKFRITIESFHAPGKATLDNALNLAPDVLKRREVVNLDIAKDKIEAKDYHAEQDPSKVRSEKANRGPLSPADWASKTEPLMTVYKVFTAEFRVMGLQDRVESFIQKTNHSLILLFHRKLFCFLDQYYDMTIADIRAFEERTKLEMTASIESARAEKGMRHTACTVGHRCTWTDVPGRGGLAVDAAKQRKSTGGSAVTDAKRTAAPPGTARKNSNSGLPTATPAAAPAPAVPAATSAAPAAAAAPVPVAAAEPAKEAEAVAAPAEETQKTELPQDETPVVELDEKQLEEVAAAAAAAAAKEEGEEKAAAETSKEAEASTTTTA